MSNSKNGRFQYIAWRSYWNFSDNSITQGGMKKLTPEMNLLPSNTPEILVLHDFLYQIVKNNMRQPYWIFGDN